MTTKSKGSSVRQKLTDLNKKNHIPYQNLETAFIIERLVARLVASKKLAQDLVFKGGFVGLRVYESHRYTVDLDALLVNAKIDSTLMLVKQKVECDLDDGDQIDLATQGEYGGIRLVSRAGIGEILKDLKKAKIVHFDLGIGDPVTPGPRQMLMPALLSKNEEISWAVYSVETIIAEKIHAIITYGNINSRSKDVHDLSVFLPKANAAVLAEALKRCFAFRKTDLPRSLSAAIKSIDTKSLERGWTSAIASVPEASPFKVAFELVINQIAKLETSFP